MTVTLGVSILRRSSSLVGIQGTGAKRSIVFERSCSRPPGTSPADNLRELLKDLPLRPSEASLAIAMSTSDLACADAWTLPQALRGQSAEKVGAALCETRCATETLETLAVDVRLSGPVVQAIALDRTQVGHLLNAAPGFKIVQLTSVPAALALAFGKTSFQQGGERFEIKIDGDTPSWRAHPVDGPDDTSTLSWQGLDVPAGLAAAFAVAVCNPDQSPNLLQALPQYRNTFAKRFRDVLVSLAAAAALCFAGLGLHFHREVTRERDETAAARRAEMELWGRFLPSQEPREGRLLKSMRDRLDDLGETSGSAEFPSALAFWGEIGKQMPDPDALGLTLESLDLAPDGGRLSARVPVVKDDPLKNASQLEGKLNQSGKMTARGDYEVREGQVQVRLRMDYKP